LEIVRACAGQKGFAVQPKRWIVERTISWLNWSLAELVTALV